METRVYFSTGWLLLPRHIRLCVAGGGGQLDVLGGSRFLYGCADCALREIALCPMRTRTKMNGVVESEYERQISA